MCAVCEGDFQNSVFPFHPVLVGQGVGDEFLMEDDVNVAVCDGDGWDGRCEWCVH